ncbi:DEAD/DEAH box helicase [Anaeromyxobacter diazotrophicus]|uniref:DEAD/DEAH box helicase n=1 Tax=Anaeromyxobacter diazotrophicus TaxID=2590199 RepID=UPI001F1D3F9D|nr:DEAD/DEAH box helicase [Anaeromyxobacter diazotrophicus]
MAPSSDYVAERTFDDLHLSDELRRGIADRGYTRPTPVQAATFGPIVAGKDVIVRSKTGTGKTAAFGIPILEKIPGGRRRPSALVMCPTRELALQVAEEIAALAKHKDLSVVAIYGGASMGDQLDALKRGAEIVVGTPGRILDHIRRRTLDLGQMQVCCLDEADEMLNMGFFEEVTHILDHLPDACQQLLFSATVPADIEHLISKYLTEPETILLSGDEYRVDNIRNVFFHTVEDYPKPRNLLYMIEMEEPESGIVFCNTRSDTGLVTAVLNRNGYDAELLNGELPQKERERVMAKAKRGEVRFMVATDIAARGIDISDLTHIINYSLPEDPAVYLHRAGRTGRIGKKGTALSLVSGAEMMTLKALQTKYGVTFEEKTLPPAEEARRIWTERRVDELKEAMSSTVFEAFIPLAQRLKARPDGDWLIAFALKYFFSHLRMEKVQEQAKAQHKREEHEQRTERAEAPRAELPARGRRGADRAPRGVEHRERGEAESEGRGRRERAVGEAEGGGRRGRRGGNRAVRGLEEQGAATPTSMAAGTSNGHAEASSTPTSEISVERGRGVAPAPEPSAGESAPQRPPRGRVFLTYGEKDAGDEAKVRAAVAALAPGVELLGVEVRQNHSFLEVAPEAVEQTVAALNAKEWEGKPLAAEKARRRRR